MAASGAAFVAAVAHNKSRGSNAAIKKIRARDMKNFRKIKPPNNR
jgi:hypothetical protein